MQNVRLELGRVGDITLRMLHDIRPAFQDRDKDKLADIARRDDEVDILEAEILRYLGKVRQGLLTEAESHEQQALMMATDNLENLADVIETDLVALGYKAVELTSRSSDETRELLVAFYTTITESVEAAVKSVRDNDQRAAETVLMMKDSVRAQSEGLLMRKAQHLTGDDQDYLELVRLEMTFVDQMRRMYTLSKRIAKVSLPAVLANQD
jgi:phosphate:Na+ symporter